MAKHQYPSDRQDQYMVRFPDGMRDHLKDSAAKNNRSLNAEIVARITEHPKLLEFWMSADSRIAALGERAHNADTLREENEKLKHQVAYQEGVIASLRENIDVFLKHLASPDLKHYEVLDAIIADIKVMRGKD